MERKDYEKIVKKHFGFKIKKELKVKQVFNIMKYVATDIKENDIIGFDDTGLMKNGKSGFLITKDAFYNSSHNMKIPFKDLENITYTKEGSVTVQTAFHYKDGSVLEDKIIIASPEEFIEVLREIVREYNAETVVVKTQKKKAVAKVPVTESKITKEEAPVVHVEIEEPVKEEAPALEKINYEELGFEYYNAGDYENAYQYLMKGANEGNARCMNKIGIMHYFGKGVEKDYAKALEWYEKSGDAGFPRAYGNVGYYYENVEVNEKEGFNWYEKGALAGDAYCQYMVGVRLENGAEGVSQDLFKAYYWYTRSAEQNNERAFYYLGSMYKKGNGVPKDTKKAFEYFKKGAELGDKQAKEELSNFSASGELIETPVTSEPKMAAPEPKKVNSPKKAEVKKEAAPSGKELVEQGYIYQEGKDVPYNPGKAYECYEKAVELNYAPAYYYLANMYKKGWYVGQSNEKACELLVKGAELGDMRAMDELIEGTAHSIYIPSKNMLKKMVEYGKTTLAGDSYFKPFVERIEVLANTEGDVEAFLCFTEDDLNQGVICTKCGNVLYPVPGKKMVYCTKCFTMVKAENVKRNHPVKQAENSTSVPAEKPVTLEKKAQTLEEKLQKIYAESGTSRMYETEVSELIEALEVESDIAYLEDDYETTIEKSKVLALFKKDENYLHIATCYSYLDMPKEAVKWADQIDISNLDVSNWCVALAGLANVYYEEKHIEKAYYIAKLAADCGEEEAKELLEAIEEEHGKIAINEAPKPEPKKPELPKVPQQTVTPQKVTSVRNDSEYEKARKANLEQALKATQSDYAEELYKKAQFEKQNRNHKRAERLYLEAAQVGHVGAIKWVGKYNGARHPDIVEQLLKLSKKGDVEAGGILGHIYMSTGKKAEGQALLQKVENTEDEFLKEALIKHYLEGEISISSNGIKKLDAYMQAKKRSNYEEWVYVTRQIQKAEDIHIVAVKYLTSYNRDKEKKAQELYAFLVEQNMYLYDRSRAKQALAKNDKYELVTMVEMQYAKENIKLAEKAMKQKSYEEAYDYYKGAYENAKLSLKNQKSFSYDKKNSPEGEILKKVTCTIAHMYAEGKLGTVLGKSAKEWCQNAADDYNDAAGMYVMAQMKKGNPMVYLEWLEKAAKAGYAPAVKEFREGEATNWKNSPVFTRKHYYIDKSCTNCLECMTICEVDGALDFYDHVIIDDNYCTGCGKCMEFCKKISVGAIKEGR